MRSKQALSPQRLSISAILVADMSTRSMRIPVKFNKAPIAGKQLALIDSGAQGKFINRRTVKQLNLKEKPLTKPIKVCNVDKTPNELGYIQNYVETDLEIAGKTTTTKLLVTQLGKQDIIIGIDWLQEHNPQIN